MSSESRQLPQRHEQGAPNFGAPRKSFFDSFTRGLNILGTLLILAMALAVNADIVGRNAFNRPLPGVLEFVGLSIVAIVFLQLANTLREDRHVSNDILMGFVIQNWPRIAASLYTAFYLVGAALMGLIVWFVWPILIANYQGGYFRGAVGILTIPTWPFIVPIVIGAAATAIQFLLLAWRSFLRAAGRE